VYNNEQKMSKRGTDDPKALKNKEENIFRHLFLGGLSLFCDMEP